MWMNCSVGLRKSTWIGGGLELVAQGELIIDGHDARRSLLIDNSSSSGTLFACFIADGAAWLLSTTFSPLGYGEMYERIFELASASFHLITEKDQPPSVDESPPEAVVPQEIPAQAAVHEPPPGLSWQEVSVGNIAPLSDVHGAEQGNVVAVSLFVGVLQFASTQWTNLRSPSGTSLHAAWSSESEGHCPAFLRRERMDHG